MYCCVFFFFFYIFPFKEDFQPSRRSPQNDDVLSSYILTHNNLPDNLSELYGRFEWSLDEHYSPSTLFVHSEGRGDGRVQENKYEKNQMVYQLVDAVNTLQQLDSHNICSYLLYIDCSGTFNKNEPCQCLQQWELPVERKGFDEQHHISPSPVTIGLVIP